MGLPMCSSARWLSATGRAVGDTCGRRAYNTSPQEHDNRNCHVVRQIQATRTWKEIPTVAWDGACLLYSQLYMYDLNYKN